MEHQDSKSQAYNKGKEVIGFWFLENLG